MNLKKISTGLLAALLLTACANEDIPSGPQTPGFQGNGYVAVNIQLPTQPGSRAANDNYDDGDEDEYAVNDAVLVLFTGTSEADAIFAGAYSIDIANGDKENDVDNDNITTTYLRAVEVSANYKAGESLFGLVMLNTNGIVSTSTDRSLTVGSQIFTVPVKEDSNTRDGETTTVAANTFNDLLQGIKENTTINIANGDTIVTDNKFRYEATDNEGKKHQYIFMTNAPLSSAIGGAKATEAPIAGKVSTLVNITANFKPTKDEAIAAAKQPAAPAIFVERALAKVTLSVGGNYDQTDITNEDNQNVKITVLEWTLGNVEKSSFYVRNLGDKGFIGYTSSLLGKIGEGTDAKNIIHYRFVGDTPMGETSLQPEKELYRTYWCIDPNYDTDKTYVSSLLEFVDMTKNKPLYCNENTFDVGHQNYQNTTRVVLKATFTKEDLKEGESKDFCTINGSEKVYSVEDAESYLRKAIVESQAVKEAFKEALKDNLTNVDIDQYIKISFARNNQGIYEATGITFEVPNDLLKVTGSQPSLEEGGKHVLESANERYVIAYYLDGASYYDVRIMHFAGKPGTNQDLAPWDENDHPDGATKTDEAYAGNAPNFLGRYGMVRNNWYDLNVTAIKNLGSPVVPNANVNTSDDNKEVNKFVAFKINILSWAKRTQNVDF